jgi:hypothetical protein
MKVLVHGDRNEMARLRSSLADRYAEKNIKIYTPKNSSVVTLHFKTQKTCRVVGSIADKYQEMRTNDVGKLDGMDIDESKPKYAMSCYYCTFFLGYLTAESYQGIGIYGSPCCQGWFKRDDTRRYV